MYVMGLLIAIIFFAGGVIGTILPGLPGAPMVWLGMLIYGLFVGFKGLTWAFFLGQGLAVALVFFLDYAANVWGVRRYGGSKYAVWGSLIGVLLGVILMGPVGIVFGPFIGAVAGELYAKQNFEKAVRVGLGTLLGLLGSTVLKLLVLAGMIIWFFATI